MSTLMKTRRIVAQGVRLSTPFRHGNLWAEWTLYPSWGQLPVPFIRQLKNIPGEVFVVYSYNTPIGWRSPIVEWTIPDVKYSVSTSHHQNMLRVMVANPDMYR
jgi:hypothetical protein